MKNYFYKIFKSFFREELRNEAKEALFDAYQSLFHDGLANHKAVIKNCEMDELVYNYEELSELDNTLVGRFLNNINL